MSYTRESIPTAITLAVYILFILMTGRMAIKMKSFTSFWLRRFLNRVASLLYYLANVKMRKFIQLRIAFGRYVWFAQYRSLQAVYRLIAIDLENRTNDPFSLNQIALQQAPIIRTEHDSHHSIDGRERGQR